MKKILALAIAVMAVFLVGSATWAWDDAKHVVQAPNGLNDMGWIPVYLAAPSWDTKFCLTNTAKDRSSVVKVIIRSRAFTQELLDFLIYLSPTDKWCGYLRWDAAKGRPVIYSADDSIVASLDGNLNPVFATSSAPVNQPLVDVDCPNWDTNAMGYVTWIEAWSSNQKGKAADWNCDLSAPPVKKECIYKAYNNFFAQSNDGPYNIIASEYLIQLARYFTAGDRASGMRDYQQVEKLTVSTESFVGLGAKNTLCEVEAAISKQRVIHNYMNKSPNSSILWFTFPTKYSYDYSDDCDHAIASSPFSGFTTGDFDGVKYEYQYYDMKENTPGGEGVIFSPYKKPDPKIFPWEVNFLVSTDENFISSNYTEGWVNFDFAFSTTCAQKVAPGVDVLNYSGAPLLSSAWQITANGVGIIPAAYKNGKVIGTGGHLPFYQYKNDAADPDAEVIYP